MINLLVALYCIGTMSVPLFMVNSPENEIRNFYKENYPEIYERIKDKMLLGSEVNIPVIHDHTPGVRTARYAVGLGGPPIFSNTSLV